MIAPLRGSGPGPAGGTVTGLAHVAIATPDADALAALLVSGLGATRGAEELLDGGALRVAFVHLGPITLELLEPRAADHTVARFLAARGAGIHHVSLEVADLAAALERCRAAGLMPVDETPRAGAHDSRVAFLHPKSAGGVLIELCERKAGPGSI
jgi:methylmalonyl-CoA/ethylmalonyl-CoA epimerase